MVALFLPSLPCCSVVSEFGYHGRNGRIRKSLIQHTTRLYRCFPNNYKIVINRPSSIQEIDPLHDLLVGSFGVVSITGDGFINLFFEIM